MITFASCSWNGSPGAKNHIQKMYPDKTIKDELIPILIDLINRDVLRVQDPAFHQPYQIITGNNYTEFHDDEINMAIKQFETMISDQDND